MSELPIKLTVKSGAGFDAPWLTVDANDPSDLEFKVDALLAGSVLEKSIALAELFKAANNAAPLVQQPPQQAAPAQQAPPQQQWGQPQQGPAPTWATGAQPAAVPTGPVNGTPHPTGQVCPLDGQVLQYKQITAKATGKQFKMWTCPNQKSRGDGHAAEFID